jgi:hypothetical protein
VQVHRDPIAGLDTPGPNGKVYIGDAILVAGARPDVEAIYLNTMPRPNLAGWGYMMLTNFLPDTVAVPKKSVGGNGTFTLYAYATDYDGKTTLLGSKTITCSNSTATKPFGTIDTPAQGGTASGSGFANFGWALTPLPGTIPTNGSTISVFVDGAPIGSPTYNLFRSDIASLFPGYNNTNGAVGLFGLNTTSYANGVHNLAWSVTDNLGRVDGIGSRFFTVLNGSGDALPDGGRVEMGSLGGEYGADLGRSASSDEGAEIPLAATAREMGRVAVGLPPESAAPGSTLAAYFVNGDRLDRLPVGASFDPAERVLYWQPAAGFSGEYRFLVVETGPGGESRRWPVLVRLVPQ